jgi:hypothetical protein
MNRKQDKILHIFKINPKKFWRKILTRKTKENNQIPLKDWSFYLKNMYESPNILEKSPYDLGKKLITLEEIFSSMGMIVNNDKKKVMIIKSKRITYDSFFYDNNILEEVPS